MAPFPLATSSEATALEIFALAGAIVIPLLVVMLPIMLDVRRKGRDVHRSVNHIDEEVDHHGSGQTLGQMVRDMVIKVERLDQRLIDHVQEEDSWQRRVESDLRARRTVEDNRYWHPQSPEQEGI